LDRTGRLKFLSAVRANLGDAETNQHTAFAPDLEQTPSRYADRLWEKSL